MSWGISSGGVGGFVAENVAAQCEGARKYGAPAGLMAQSSQVEHHNNVMNAIEDLARVLASRYPDRIVTFSSNGHLDDNYGNATVDFKVYPKPT
jgi:hypothetical protein